jgi:DNA-binding CsgD family transcriptional regulator
MPGIFSFNPRSGVQPLKSSETEVLAYLSLGHTNVQIREAMGIAEKTLQVHLQCLREKLGCENTRQLIVYGAEQRIRAELELQRTEQNEQPGKSV